jgi:hypothetical protein
MTAGLRHVFTIGFTGNSAAAFFGLLREAGVKRVLNVRERPDRQERDAFVDDVFRVARLPVLRVQARAAYAGEDMGQRVRAAVGGGA